MTSGNDHNDVQSNLPNLSEIMHVIISRNARMTITISVSPGPPLQKSEIHTMLKNTRESSHIEILEITQMEQVSGDESDNQIYKIIYLIIPNELFDKLRDVAVKNCIFYVGLSENSTYVDVLNGVPELHRLAHTNREGEPSPYMSIQITIS